MPYYYYINKLPQPREFYYATNPITIEQLNYKQQAKNDKGYEIMSEEVLRSRLSLANALLKHIRNYIKIDYENSHSISKIHNIKIYKIDLTHANYVLNDLKTLFTYYLYNLHPKNKELYNLLNRLSVWYDNNQNKLR